MYCAKTWVVGLIDHNEKASKSAVKISGTETTLSGFSGVAVGEGAGVARDSEVEPAIQIVPVISTVAAVATEGEAGSRAKFHSSFPVVSMARAKDLSPLFPKITTVLPVVTKPENSSGLPIEVTSFKGFTADFLTAAVEVGTMNKVAITTSEIKRFTLIPASDLARLS